MTKEDYRKRLLELINEEIRENNEGIEFQDDEQPEAELPATTSIEDCINYMAEMDLDAGSIITTCVKAACEDWTNEDTEALDIPTRYST